MKAPKKQNKMLYSISKKSRLSRELNSIKKIKAKSPKKRSYSISNSSGNGSGSDSSLYIDSEIDEKIQPTERK